MRSGQKVQRRHQEPHEMVRNQRGGPVQRLNRTSWRTLCHKAAAKFEETRVSQLSSIDEQSGSSAHNHSTTLVPGRAAAAPGSATPELDFTHMNGLIDDKKRSVVPTAQSKVCVCVLTLNYDADFQLPASWSRSINIQKMKVKSLLLQKMKRNQTDP